MENREYQICNRCIMDTSDPFIEFDEHGNCNHCNEFFNRKQHIIYKGKESDLALEKLVVKIKKSGKKKDYDVVLGVSGGIDSSYTAYMARKLGLRVLAVHLDNGWNSDEAVKNIRKICNQLDIDYISHVLDWAEFRDLQLAFLKASIVEMEIPTDVAIPAALHKVASDHGIKYILSGGNYATEGILPDSWFYNPKDLKLLKAINKRFGTKKLKSFPTFEFKRELYYKFIKGIRYVYLLNFVPYSKDEAVKILKDELNWQYYGGKHYESKFTGFIQSYIQPVKFGIDYRRVELATQVCTNVISREDALEQMKKPSYDDEKVEREIEYVAKKLEISVKEFKEILNLPKKTYRDYPNSEKQLNFFYKIYRKIFGNN